MGYALLILDETADCIDLILHQGDQGGNDDGRPFHAKGGQLVAQRLAAAGRHQHKSVAAPDEMHDDLFLEALESVEAEKAL